MRSHDYLRIYCIIASRFDGECFDHGLFRFLKLSELQQLFTEIYIPPL